MSLRRQAHAIEPETKGVEIIERVLLFIRRFVFYSPIRAGVSRDKLPRVNRGQAVRIPAREERR
jgi:hypothetical protein